MVWPTQDARDTSLNGLSDQGRNPPTAPSPPTDSIQGKSGPTGQRHLQGEPVPGAPKDTYLGASWPSIVRGVRSWLPAAVVGVESAQRVRGAPPPPIPEHGEGLEPGGAPNLASPRCRPSPTWQSGPGVLHRRLLLRVAAA